MTNRKLTASDARLYWNLRLLALEQEPLAFGMSPEEHRLTTVEDAAALISNDRGFILGAFDGEMLAGMARFERERGAKESHKGHVYGVYFAVSHRGGGAAREMLAALISAVRAEPGMEQLLLSVGVSNRSAQALYHALGFVGYGIEPRALKYGNTYVDEEHMILHSEYRWGRTTIRNMDRQRRTVLQAMGVGAMVFAAGSFEAGAQDSSGIFELRVYHTVEGRLPALLARFRDHTVGLFAKHGMTSVAYWTPTDDPVKGKTLIYILKHPSRDAATKNWKAFQEDGDWVKVKSESEAAGPIVEKVDSTFMELTDFSPKL